MPHTKRARPISERVLGKLGEDAAPSLHSPYDMKKMASFLRTFGANFFKHDLLTLAASLAFYTSLSLAPLLLITLSVLSVLGRNSADSFLAQVNEVVGSQAAEAVKLIITNAQHRQDLSIVGALTGGLVLLFSASGTFSQLQSSLNVIWNVGAEGNDGIWAWVRHRAISMGMVFSLGFLSIVSLALSTVISFLFQQSTTLWGVFNNLLTLGIFMVAFACIYKVLPDTKIKWRHALRGGVITSILFSIGKQLIGIYLGSSAVGSAYGATGSLIVFLVWVYYSALILFIGAEITAIQSQPPVTSLRTRAA